MKYKSEKAGEWIRPKKKGYKMMCCDCGLVHRMQFEHIPYGSGRIIIFRAWRDERATSVARSQKRRKHGKAELP